MASHYGAAAALRQKAGALAGRTATQARDVFDLHHLIAGGAPLSALAAMDRDVVDQAQARATDMDFSAFTSQVVSYLTPESRNGHSSPRCGTPSCWKWSTRSEGPTDETDRCALDAGVDGEPVFETGDAAARLNLSNAHASAVLARLTAGAT